MKSRFFSLHHLAVMPVLLWEPETWTPSVKLYRASRFVYGSMTQRMEGRRRRSDERWLEWHLRTFRGGLARAEAMRFPRGDRMVIAKRSKYAGHNAHPENHIRRYINSWGFAISLGGGTTKDAGGTTGTFTDGLELNAAGNSTSMTTGKSTVLNGRLWRETD